MLALAAAAACGTLGPDFNQVIAIEVFSADSVEERDTLRPHARALDGRGDSVAATIAWAALDTTLAVVDPASGRTVGRFPGTGRLQASTGTLKSNLLNIRIVPAADTLFAPGQTVDVVSLAARPDSLSDSLATQLQDTTAAGPVNLSGRRVVFALTRYPAGAGQATLVTTDTSVHVPVTTDTVKTQVGVAAVRVRLLGGPLPDSVVVMASANRAIGAAVPGSPVKFIVEFQP